MFSLSQQPQHVHNIFSNSFHLYKKIWKPLFPFLVLLSLLSCSLAILPPIIEPVLSKTTDPVSLNDLISSFIVHKPLIWVFSTLILLMLYFGAATLYTAYHHMMSSYKEASLNKALLEALKRSPIYLFTFILFLISFLAGTALVILPGVFIFTLFYFYLLIIMVEKPKSIDSLERSAILVWSHWWRTFIVAILPLIVCEFLFGWIALKATDILMSHFKLPFIIADDIAESFWTIVYTFLIIPWLISLQVCQFHDLKNRLEYRIKGKIAA